MLFFMTAVYNVLYILYPRPIKTVNVSRSSAVPKLKVLVQCYVGIQVLSHNSPSTLC